MHQRPAWLKALAGVDEDTVESPAAASLGSFVLDYSRSAMPEEIVVEVTGISKTNQFVASPDNDVAVGVEVVQEEEDASAESSADNEWRIGGVVLSCL